MDSTVYDLDLSKWSFTDEYSVSNQFKTRLLLFVTALCLVIYAGLTTVNLLSGYYVVCLLNVLFMASISTFAITVCRLKNDFPRWTIGSTLVLLVLSSTAPVYYMGITGALWCFPIMIAVFFLLPMRIALATNGSLVVLSSTFSLLVLELPLGIRMTVALVASFLLGAIFSYRIRSMQRNLRHLSTTDPMTGAYNRRLLMEHLTQSLTTNMAGSHPSHPGSVIAVFDLDYFKRINDEYGHSAGDRAIIELVRVIRAHVRESDCVFRLGGDEVLLLLRDCSDKEACKILNAICHSVRANRTIGTSASIGAATSRLSDNVENWMHRADSALYEAKRNGRNQVVTAFSA